MKNTVAALLLAAFGLGGCAAPAGIALGVATAGIATSKGPGTDVVSQGYGDLCAWLDGEWRDGECHGSFIAVVASLFD